MSVLNELNNLYEADPVAVAKAKVKKMPPKQRAAAMDKKVDPAEEAKAKKQVDQIKKGINKGNVEQKLDNVKGGMDNAKKALDPSMYQTLQSGWDMVHAYIRGEYKTVPWETILTVVGELIYIFSPVDIIPDVIPVVGWIDDVLIATKLWPAIKNDITKFQEWQATQGKPDTEKPVAPQI